MKKPIAVLAALCIGVALAAPVAAQTKGYKLIVNKANPAVGVSKSKIAMMFMKMRDKWDDGQAVEPVDQVPSSPVRESLSKDVQPVLNARCGACHVPGQPGYEASGPRVSGTNTPLKIYSFLKAGKPLVATNLWTHTQVADETIAVLAPPEPDSFAAGLSRALESEEARERGRAAKRMADSENVYPKYLEKMKDALARAIA